MFLHPIKMRKLSLYISKDHIKSILFELGKYKCIEFSNLNYDLKSDDLPFSKELLWLERKKGKLDAFSTELDENGISIAEGPEEISDLHEIVILENRDEVKDPSYFEEMDDHFYRLQELKKMKAHISERLQELRENLKILSLLNEQDLTAKSCLSGIIETSKLNVLKKILETVLRNNLLFISSNFGDSTVFLIFTHGKEAYARLIQICTSFGSRLYSEQFDEQVSPTKLRDVQANQEEDDDKAEESTENETTEFNSNENESSEENDKVEKNEHATPRGGFSAINLLSKLHLPFKSNENTDNKQEDEKEMKRNPNKSEILKANSLIQQYTHLSETNQDTIQQELLQISKKLHKWYENVKINLRILKAMNKMKQTTAFVAEGYVPVSEMILFEQLINQICENMGRIAYEDKEERNKPLLVTGTKTNYDDSLTHLSDLRISIDGNESQSDPDSNNMEQDSMMNNTGSNRNTISNYDTDSKIQKRFSPDHENLKQRVITHDALQKETENYLDSPKEVENLMIIKDKDGNLSDSLEDLRQAQHNFQAEDEKETEREIIPTFFKVNQFTRPFQNMNDVYGVPTYTEINPSLFTAITFPFLFGSMFGDVGHGLVLLFIAIIFIKNDKLKKVNEMVKMVVDAKYMLLVCSLYAIFFGFIYSDFFGLPINFFKINNTTIFGINPDIHKSEDHLNIMNSIKMKLAVLIGTVHMGMGLIINILNTYYKKEKSVFLCRTLPKLISFSCFTGYVFVLVIVKFIIPFKQSIINTVVGMFTDPFNTDNFFFKGQFFLQMSLLSLFIICVPWMLISYPVICFLKKRKEKNSDGVSPKKSSEESLLDITIHTGIETIEFNLGLISNISSYLRIWAVSLAHNQLTVILHTYMLGQGINIILKILLFPLWAAATFLLLICLEGLSSSLHAMRLNWIEFNSKFYNGQGRKFTPLCFDEEDSDED